MADFDLRKLSAPIEALRPELEAAYKRLDAKWKAVIDQLQKLLIPCDVSYTYSENDGGPECCAIEWRKWNGLKRICDVYFYEEMGAEGPEGAERVTPFEEWGAEQRIQMLEHIPGLFESAAVQTKAFLKRIQDKEGK